MSGLYLADDAPPCDGDVEPVCADCGVPADEPCPTWCPQAPQTRQQLDAADDADAEHDDERRAA